MTTFSEARHLPGRWFIKTPREKGFEAGVYSADELLRPTAQDPVVLLSDVVTFTSEYRLFVLDGKVHAGSRYLAGGYLDERNLDDDLHRADVLTFAQDLLADQATELPSAVTVDVGWAVNADRPDEGWAVGEANMAWFSNIYGSGPDRALEVVLRSAGPWDALPALGGRFVR
jgi:ATP-grasp domain, R2K clade family 2